MSSRLDKAIKDFIQIIREAGNKGTSPLDAQAEVLRIDEDGTAWVHLPGGVDETPVKLTINAKVGDKVYVRLSGGRAWITGNQTAPPTDDKTAEQAKEDAANASKVATNFMEYDSTNGLIVGNKTSGLWSGYRSQILPGSFNVLDPSSTVLASFGPTTIIGEEAKANMHLTFNNLSMVDKDGTTLFEVGDNRNAEGIATIKHTTTVSVNSTGSATVTVNSNISSIVSVYADSVQLSSSSYSFSQKDVTINGLTADSQTSIEITYTTTESTVYLTFGERDSSGNIGNYSVAEGYMTTASGYSSHAEGERTTASGLDSHAEGYMTTASGSYSHAEGWKTIASGRYSHAEGEWTEAIDSNSHAEGYNTTAKGHCSHAEGAHTLASGSWSHAAGYMTVADNNYMTAIGQYNTKNSGKAFVIGNGYDDKTRSNAFAVSWAGSVDIAYNIFMELGACYVRDNTFDKTLSVIDGATTLDGLLAQAIINTFSYADAIEILGEEITGRNANINVKKLLQKIVENQRDTGWVNLTTKKGTWNYCQYRYKNGIVYIRGHATAYAWSGSTGDVVVAAGTIPSQYRPPDNLDLIVRCGGTRWGQVVVTTEGGIVVDRILNGTASYTTSSWIRFNGSYPI